MPKKLKWILNITGGVFLIIGVIGLIGLISVDGLGVGSPKSALDSP